MLYDYHEIKGVHLEVTTKCNANCVMCGRNAFGIIRPGLKMAELGLDDCKKIFPPAFLRQLENISMCGVYGDPILARDFLEIIDYIYASNPKLKVDIYTNGGIHPASWWKKLAGVLKNGQVIFGIDGLEDTHNINRQGTRFGIILANAKSFINAGGRAQWDYIVFKHNEHQVKQARRLSKELGFKSFQVKRTSRFYKFLFEHDPALHDSDERFGQYPAFDKKGRRCGYIELPKNPYYRNNSLKTIRRLIKEFGSLEKYFSQARIDCQAIRTKGIFVSAEGLVFPCCWVYQQANYGLFYKVTDPSELNESAMLKETGGTEKISAKIYSIKEIVRGNFFEKLRRDWSICGLENGRPKVCAQHCGSRLDVHGKQHEKK